jgi:hypothetical protein
MTATRVLARSLLPVGLLVVLTLSPEPMRADAPLSAKELAQLVGTEWYRVTVMGRPNGYARIETALVPTEGGKRLCVTEELRILVKVAGRDLQASKSQVTVYDERLRPARIELAKDELGRSSHLTATLDGDVLIVRSGPDGPGSPEPVEKRIQVPADLASDLLIQMRLLRGEIAVGDRFEYAVYDPEVELLDRHTVVVERHETLDGADTLVLSARSEALGIEVLSWVDDTGVLLRQTVPGLMELMLERVSEGEALASLAPLEIHSQLPLDHHLPLVSSLREVHLRVRRNVGSAVELIPSTRRQKVVADGDDALVSVTRETPPTGDVSRPLPGTDESLADFLQPTRYAQSDDPRLVETAREIIGDETDAWGAAQLLCSWVYRSMQKVASEPRPITALEALEEMRGDCTEHAILLAGLGRAVGLPTRLITGLAYVGGKLGYHAWTEVYVGRWIEMDPAWGQMTVDAGHLQIYASALDEASYARASLATGRTLGAVEIELLGYVAADGREVGFEEGQL